jgi:hypothetical protein
MPTPKSIGWSHAYSGQWDQQQIFGSNSRDHSLPISNSHLRCSRQNKIQAQIYRNLQQPTL